VKNIYLLNVVVKQEILTKTQKTEQATHCSVTRNRVPFITHYCKLIINSFMLRIEKMLKNK